MNRHSIRSLAALLVAGAGMLLGTGVAFAKAPPSLYGKFNAKYHLILESKDKGGHSDPIKNQQPRSKARESSAPRVIAATDATSRRGKRGGF